VQRLTGVADIMDEHATGTEKVPLFLVFLFSLIVERARHIVEKLPNARRLTAQTIAHGCIRKPTSSPIVPGSDERRLSTILWALRPTDSLGAARSLHHFAGEGIYVLGFVPLCGRQCEKPGSEEIAPDEPEPDSLLKVPGEVTRV
jgi:hypothetical protein